MSCGWLSAESVQWTIPDFLSLDSKCKGEWIESPRFRMADSTWHLSIYPKGDAESSDGYLSAYLIIDDAIIEKKTVEFSISIKVEDEEVEEVEMTERFDENNYRHGWLDFVDWHTLQMYRIDPMPPGSLTFTCSIRREQTPESEKVINSSRMVITELETLSSDFKNLLNSDIRRDVTIFVQGREFTAHRAVLAARSSVFRAMYEHDTEEAKSGQLKIPDCDPESFGDFLHFLYTGKLELSSFATAHGLYSTAEKYDVQRLKEYCSHYMRLYLTPEDFCKVILLCDRFSDIDLLSWAQCYFNENSLKIFLTDEWTALMENNTRLADECLKEMAYAGLVKGLKKEK